MNNSWGVSYGNAQLYSKGCPLIATLLITQIFVLRKQSQENMRRSFHAMVTKDT